MIVQVHPLVVEKNDQIGTPFSKVTTSPKSSNFQGVQGTGLFSREDWTLFRNLTTLGQPAGVVQAVIPALVVKELVDNALDASGLCRYGQTDNSGLSGRQRAGLPGTDEEIAAVFSVSRPLSSSKLLRLPTRGALGNGLRVVAGAVLASGGDLTVKTHRRALRLHPRDSDGGTNVEHLGPWDGTGMRVEVRLGEALPVNESTMQWADQAAAMAAIDGTGYRGATSAWWYDSDSFYELLQAAGARPVRELAGSFAGCSGARAGKLASYFPGRRCDSLTRGEAEKLLESMRGSVARSSQSGWGRSASSTNPMLVTPKSLPHSR